MSQASHDWSMPDACAIARPVIIVVMGVSGSGKTTVSAMLAATLGCPFQEGDELHRLAALSAAEAELSCRLAGADGQDVGETQRERDDPAQELEVGALG